jgi:hypothetical protein
VFHEMDGNWEQAGTIIASDGAMADFFGFAVTLDRDTALVRASQATLSPHRRGLLLRRACWEPATALKQG